MFDEFWSKYPRKVAKVVAERAFMRLTPDNRKKAIESLDCHLAYWQACGTEKQFIPHPGTWINQGRYDDELEMPQPKQQPEAAWWASEAGVMQKGRDIGLSPRPGESIHEFKSRLIERIKAAA